MGALEKIIINLENFGFEKLEENLTQKNITIKFEQNFIVIFNLDYIFEKIEIQENEIDSLNKIIIDRIAWAIDIDQNFEEDIYEKKYPEVCSYYMPWAEDVPKRRRLFHHFFIYKKNFRKIKKIQKLNPNKVIRKCKKIIVKIPTLGRPDYLFKTLDSFFYNQSCNFDINFIISANSNDQKTNKEEIIKQIKTYEKTEIFFENHKNKIEAYNANINTNFDILIAASDDMIVLEKDYDKIIVESMEQYFPDLDGVLWFDTDDNKITNTLSIIGENYYKRFNYIYNNCYDAYYCDDELTRTAFKLGRIKKINKKIIKHEIPSHLDMSNESTYLKSLAFATKDKATYKIRKKVQFNTPGTEECVYPNVDDIFFEEKRNQNNNWKIPFTKFDEPITSLELYILEKKYEEVSKMKLEDFINFSKNYFRNFRWTITPIIHQIWIGKIPKEIEIMMDDIKKYANKLNWRYIFWNEEKLSNLEMINKDLYEGEKEPDCKADIARLEILNKFGGIYLDSDFIWLQGSISSLFNMCDKGILISYEKKGSKIGEGYLNKDTTRCTNAFIATTSYNPIIAYLIGQLREYYKNKRNFGVVASTGPDFFQKTIQSLDELKITPLDSKYFFPVWWCKDKERNSDYEEFSKIKDLSKEKISKKYPEAILFHKGFTSIK